jgi:vacuolar-type H+-ATPase subunit C/Vma6
MEIALNRRFAERALGLARGGPLAAYVRQTIDLENAFAALVLAARPEDMTPKEAFIPGGQHIGITQFEEAVAAGNAAAAATRLHRAFGDAPVARAFAPGAELAAAEPATLRLRLAALRRAARTDPLGPAPLLGFVLGLRAETADLRRLIWGLSLTAPRAQLAGQLVTV